MDIYQLMKHEVFQSGTISANSSIKEFCLRPIYNPIAFLSIILLNLDVVKYIFFAKTGYFFSKYD